MKKFSILFASIAAAAVSVAAIAQQSGQSGTADQSSQSRQDADSASSGQSGSQSNSGGQDVGKLDDETTGSTVRVSQLIGTDIKNTNGDEIGEVNDLVIDGTGKVRYAAVTYGGFLGVGSKLFAVPFEAFKVQRDPEEADDDDDEDEADDYVLMLNVTKEQLDGAQGFDTEHWPDFGDNTMTQDLDRRYKVDRATRSRQ